VGDTVGAVRGPRLQRIDLFNDFLTQDTRGFSSLGYIFNEDAARRQEAWFETPEGRAAFSLQKDLLYRLLRPWPGERLLDVGCGSGMYLEVFLKAGVSVSGLDPSPAMLDRARRRLGHRADLFPGRAEDLPFEDNEYDVVSLITCLEFVDDPAAALGEAMRVARSRVLIGVLNSLSLTGLARRVEGLFTDSFYNRARFFSLWELRGMLSRLTDPERIRWGSVQLLPVRWSEHTVAFESQPWLQSINPFGAFLGVAAEVSRGLRTSDLTAGASFVFQGRPVSTPTAFDGVRGEKEGGG